MVIFFSRRVLKHQMFVFRINYFNVVTFLICCQISAVLNILKKLNMMHLLFPVDQFWILGYLQCVKQKINTKRTCDKIHVTDTKSIMVPVDTSKQNMLWLSWCHWLEIQSPPGTYRTVDEYKNKNCLSKIQVSSKARYIENSFDHHWKWL